MPDMSLGLHPCAAAEGSCHSVYRCWDHKYVAVCSCFCAAMTSNEEKSDCKTLDMEVSVTDQECRWGFGHTEDVLPGGVQLLQIRKRYHTATLYQDSKEVLLLRLIHTQMLFSQACANFSVNAGISAEDRRWHEQLKQSSFTGTADSLQQSNAKHTIHSTCLRSQCEEGLSASRVTDWQGNCSILVISC